MPCGIPSSSSVIVESLASQKSPDLHEASDACAKIPKGGIGGTNSKLMIASTKGGHLTVEHIKAVQNPLTPTPFDHFFDDFLLRDEMVKRFLRETSQPCIGFSIPVPMPIEGVFSHISKVGGITGLIARDLKRDASSHHFGKNFRRHLNTVVMIWESTQPGGKLRKEALEIFQEVIPEAFSELQWIAGLIMRRAVSAIANSAVGTFIHMGAPENGHGHILFFEGSIVKNIFVLPGIKEEIVRLIAQEKIFEQLGLQPLPNPVMEPDMTGVRWSETLDESHMKEIDYTLIGSATAVIAESCLPGPTYNDVD